MEDGPNLIPAAEVCELLGINKSTLSRWVAAGKINPALAHAAGRWFDRAEVERVRAGEGATS